MEIKKSLINIITILSFILLIVLDFFNVSQYINYIENIDSTISNSITFASILIGFISTVYIMIQQSQDSYVFKLLEKNNLLDKFNYSFKHFILLGFIDVIILIILNFFASTFMVFKYIFYIAFPLSIYFLLTSNNLILTICKIIIAENKLKKADKKITEKNLKI